MQLKIQVLKSRSRGVLHGGLRSFGQPKVKVMIRKKGKVEHRVDRHGGQVPLTDAGVLTFLQARWLWARVRHSLYLEGLPDEAEAEVLDTLWQRLKERGLLGRDCFTAPHQNPAAGIDAAAKEREKVVLELCAPLQPEN